MRQMCYRCFWPQPLCWCGSITLMRTRTKFVILMHPHEFKRIKANTGRLTPDMFADVFRIALALRDQTSGRNSSTTAR